MLAIKKFLAVRPPVEGILFCHGNSTEKIPVPLTRYQFNAVLKKTLNSINVPTLHFSSHSFRIGAASQLAAAKYDDATIRRLGRWSQRGNTHKVYIREIIMPSFA